MDIQQLHPDLMPQFNDLLPLWNTRNGITRKVSLQAIANLIKYGEQPGCCGPTTPQGELATSTICMLNGAAATIALPTALGAINPFNGGVAWPTQSSGNAFAFDPVNGRFVAQRAVALARFSVALVGTLTATATFGVTTGPAATPYELPARFAAPVATGTAISFSGLVYNPNNLNGVINAGDYVSLAALSASAQNATFSISQFVVQSMDGQ